MITLEYKIKQLLSANIESGEVTRDIFELMDYQNTLMKECEDLARENGTVLGRIIKFPMCDSYAFYIVTKLNKKTAKINWINYGDGYMDKRIDEEGLIDINYVLDDVRGQDVLNEIFKQKEKSN